MPPFDVSQELCRISPWPKKLESSVDSDQVDWLLPPTQYSDQQLIALASARLATFSCSLGRLNLNLGGCSTTLTPGIVSALAPLDRKIRVFEFSWNISNAGDAPDLCLPPLITPHLLDAFAASLPNASILGFSNCRFSDRAYAHFEHLIKSDLSLQELRFSGFRHISPVKMEGFLSSCPRSMRIVLASDAFVAMGQLGAWDECVAELNAHRSSVGLPALIILRG